MKSLIAALAALVWAAPLSAQETAESALYVAGERFSLEQAIADATLENVGPDEPPAFQIVALGPEMRKLTVKGTKKSVRDAVREMQRAGATFYVCERDIKLAGLARKDLLSGVKVERAATPRELTRPAADAAALVRVRRLC